MNTPCTKTQKKHQNPFLFFSPISRFSHSFLAPAICTGFCCLSGFRGDKVKGNKMGEARGHKTRPRHSPRLPHDSPTISPTTFPTIRPPYRPRHSPRFAHHIAHDIPHDSPTISPTTSPRLAPPFVPFWKRDLEKG